MIENKSFAAIVCGFGAVVCLVSRLKQVPGQQVGEELRVVENGKKSADLFLRKLKTKRKCNDKYQ